MLDIMQFYEEASRHDGSHLYFLFVFVIIIVLNLFSIVYYFFNLFVTIRVKYWKTNLQRIHQAIYATCPISSVLLIMDKVLHVMGMGEVLDGSKERTIAVVQYIRITVMSPPLFSLIAIMLERIFATYYVKDYEQKKRPLIGWSIILLLFVFSFITAYVFTETGYMYVFVAAHFLLNILSYIVSLIIYRINRKYYHNNRVTKHEYSLGERFQISENIRMYKFFTTYLFVLAFFTISCTGLALLSNYDTNLYHRNIISSLFELFFTLLCIFAPYLTIKMSEPWQNELCLILVKLGLRKVTKVRNVVDKSKRLKNTFGEEMEIETSKHSEVYFNQLEKSWNRDGLCPI